MLILLRRFFFISIFIAAAAKIIYAQSEPVAGEKYRDIYPDTWVGTDAPGRRMPVSGDVGPVKTGHPRIVSIFYVTWHRDKYADTVSSYIADITRLLKDNPDARLNDKDTSWRSNIYYHWGEPEFGYFLSKDEYVIRKDMSMLADAGVDVIIMDVTNAEYYWDEWEVVFSTMEKMAAEGNKVPKFCFWAFNGPVMTVVQSIYDRIYKPGRFQNLWFYWEGKPLLIYNATGTNDSGIKVQSPNPNYDSTAAYDKNNPNYKNRFYTDKYLSDYSDEVKSFFTKRTMWWGFYEWNAKRFIGTEDNWSYGYQMNDERVKRLPIDSLVSRHNGQIEQAAVTPAQHVPANLSMVGKSWSRKDGEPELNQYDMPVSAYVPWLGKTVKNPEGYGIYFQERWDEALKVDPPFIYINDWNEWKAYYFQIPDSTTTPFMRRQSKYFFVDQYNAEFNRGIQPMKGGYTDNYYMQMTMNIRRYKGVRSIEKHTEVNSINIDGSFSDWDKISYEYRDTKGDTFHRSYRGYYGNTIYTNNSGRNDIVTCKTEADADSIYFYAETDSALTSSKDNNWMLLLIDADNNPETGWYGYDYLINKTVYDEHTTSLMKYDPQSGRWEPEGKLSYRYKNNKLELAVSRKKIGLNSGSFTLDFHWCDNPVELKDPISLCTDGDSAPNRRFNYRFIFNK
jgi:hypothetical protein